MKGSTHLDTRYAGLREDMVLSQLQGRGIRDARILKAMRRIPRHRFVPEELAEQAYEDGPLPIGLGQTISQPYIVAVMTEHLGLSGKERVLEVGTGSGYQTAILAELARDVFTVEILEALSHKAKERMDEMGYSNVHFAVGDGRSGWADEAPFDAVLAAASAESVPDRFLDQMAIGARLVLPLGTEQQDLWLFTRTREGTARRRLLPVRFVPLLHG